MVAYTRLIIEQKSVYYLDVLTPDGLAVEAQERALYAAASEEVAETLYDLDMLGRMVQVEEDECVVSSEPITEKDYRETNGCGMYDVFETRCPRCLHADTVQVVSVTLEADGETYEVEATVQSDGFDIYGQVPDFKDLSTGDELVHCVYCNASFPLSDLSLD